MNIQTHQRTDRRPGEATLPPLWIHDDGRICCRDHVGNYAACALDRSPNARLVQTPLGTWQKLTLADRAQLAELGCSPRCEICDAQARSRQHLRRIK